MKKFIQYIKKRVKGIFAKQEGFASRRRRNSISLDFAKMLLDMYDSPMAYLAVATGLTLYMKRLYVFPRALPCELKGIAV